MSDLEVVESASLEVEKDAYRRGREAEALSRYHDAADFYHLAMVVVAASAKEYDKRSAAYYGAMVRYQGYQHDLARVRDYMLLTYAKKIDPSSMESQEAPMSAYLRLVRVQRIQSADQILSPKLQRGLRDVF